MNPQSEDGRRGLTGVSETALLTLLVRATEARRPDSIIDDPMAIKLVDSIDFDFAKFGFTRRQDMALRALTFDRYTRRYLVDHPSATVVALAEGLQTSFYRLDASGVGDQFRWLTVDLPPIIELRDRLLPHSDRVPMCAQSALDFSWMDRVDPADGVFITTEGLLMYLQPDEALGLIAECAKRFPGGQMMFDLPPVFFASWIRRGSRTSLRYRVPPMPFTLSPSEVANLANTVPGIRAVHDLPMAPGRGKVINALDVDRCSGFRCSIPSGRVVTLLEFGLAERRLDVPQRLALFDAQRLRRRRVGVRGGRHRGVGRIGARDESAEAPACFEHSRRLQLAIRARHGVDRHAQLPREFAHRRQPCARWQPATPNSVDDLTSELVEQRPARRADQPEPIPPNRPRAQYRA